ncbi:unnamed protein product [Cladocopium goreaui]|uniref:Kinesin-like protein n=1 Tax=Cladocopium goreaui TaxID=2562237 RepID=A0A9P1GHG4_9DINO|nr:unnamed protein product [Cladocopium goreaui]
MTFASGLVLHYKERIAERQSQLASAEAGDARLLELRGALQEAEKAVWVTSGIFYRQVSTGIWIGATSAFQQRLAQREQLATELSFLEGMLHGGEADGESSRTFEVFRRVGVEQLLQALSVALQRENARAVLRRLPQQTTSPASPRPSRANAHVLHQPEGFSQASEATAFSPRQLGTLHSNRVALLASLILPAWNILLTLEKFSLSPKVVALTAEMADIKVKLRCSQEQFVDMLQKYYTQQLVQLEDPDAVPDWVMLSFRNELSQIFKDFKGYPKITQGQWIRIPKTALQDAQDMEKELNAQPDHEVMEVPDKVLWTQKGGKGRYQLQPNDPPQEHNGWSQEVVQRYYTEVLRMDPLPWGAFVAPQFRQAQFKPPEPDPPAGFSAATASSSTGKGSGRPHQDAALSNMQGSSVWKPQPIRTANDAQGYVKSELQKLNINEIDKLLDNSESDQKLSDLDNVPDLIEDMKSKILLLEQALESQELTMLRLRKDAKNMEEEQGELRALHAELQLSVKRSQSYWEQKLSQDLVNKEALRKFMETHQMSELDLRQLMQKSPQIDHKPQDSVKEVVDV